MARKDYIIFNSAPVLTFNTTDPFTCEGNFNNASDWYAAQTRDTPKPRPKIFGSITTSNCSARHTLQGISANLSVHGNYTAYYRKKSFKLKLDTEQNLFGLNDSTQEHDWILLADYGDNSLLRNALALYIGKQFLRSAWSATFTFVHVYIDSEYYGLYLLTDAKEADEAKVNVKVPEENYTGVDIGYFFERDDYLIYDGKDPGFVITYPDEYLPQVLPKIYHETNKSYGVDATYKDEYSISSKIYSQDQIDFLKKYMQLIYNILYEACINDNCYEINSNNIADWQNWDLVERQSYDPIAAVSKVIDLDSFVDMYLLHEYACNPDLAHSSFYFCVDMSSTGDRKLRLCCPWDFDRAFGISNGLTNPSSRYLWAKDAHYNPWISLLPQASWFIDLLKARYHALSTDGILTKCTDMLDDYATTYENDFAQNFTKYSIKWEGDLDGWVNNGSPIKIATLNEEYYKDILVEADAKELLKTWFNKRTEALTELLDRQTPPEPDPDPESDKDLAAPIITFTCDTSIVNWYSEATRWSEKLRIPGTITTRNCDQKFVLQDVEADLRVRGNYTSDYSKKPFQIRFAEKQNLFGLNDNHKHKKWILLTEYTGGDMQRNATAMYMAQQIFKDTGIWIPTCTYAHFYIRDSERLYYMGLFLLIDQKEQAKNRVNVFEPEDGYEGTDIGYFFERDDYYKNETSDPTFIMYDDAWFGREFQPVAPVKTNHESNKWARQADGAKRYGDGYTIKSKITSDNQVNFLKERIKKVYEVMYRAVHYNEYYEITDNNELVPSSETNTKDALSKTINLTSFVNRYILEELLCNPDLAHSSFYFSLDMSEQGDKLFTLACPWDYDRTFGLTNGFANDPVEAGLWAKQCTYGWWISMLTECDWFMDLVKQRWQELYDSCFMRKVLNLQDSYSETYVNDFAKNYAEWNIHWGINKTWNIRDTQGELVIPNDIPIRYELSTEEEYKEILQVWVDNRLKVLHQLFGGKGSTDWPDPPVPPDPPGPEPPGPEPDPGKDGQIFRKDKLVKAYTEETWNQMYNRAASKADQLTKLWNMIYSSRSNAAVLFYNKMYMAVASGKSLEDPELQAEIRAWNAQAAR